ncbi:MAG: hypothetical protein GDA55_01440 [Cellvibrionales bacterium]|nr:hypothetical protein [Cellvibrionales bacterium]
MRTKPPILPVATLMCALLGGCASPSIPRDYQFQPATNAERKLFTYAFAPTPQRVAPASQNRTQPTASPISFQKMRKTLAKDARLAAYCTQGYFIYQQSFDGQHYRLHGECQESL